MPCRFIGEAEFDVVQITFTFYLNFISPEDLIQPLHLVIIYGLIDNHDSIIDITSLNEIIIQQHFQFMKKNESATWCDIGFKICDVFQSGMLRT